MMKKLSAELSIRAHQNCSLVFEKLFRLALGRACLVISFSFTETATDWMALINYNHCTSIIASINHNCDSWEVWHVFNRAADDYERVVRATSKAAGKFLREFSDSVSWWKALRKLPRWKANSSESFPLIKRRKVFLWNFFTRNFSQSCFSFLVLLENYEPKNFFRSKLSSVW